MAFSTINQSDIEWALDSVNLPGTGAENKIEPTPTLKSVGVDFEQELTAEELNWMFYKYYKAFEELESRTVVAGQLPIGSVYTNTVDSRNPNIILGYGTWNSLAGRVLVGAGTWTDDRGESKTLTAGSSMGEYQHVQTESELVPHRHLVVNGSSTQANLDNSSQSLARRHPGDGDPSYTATGSTSEPDRGRTSQVGLGQPANNMQPTLVAYMWERVG